MLLASSIYSYVFAGETPAGGSPRHQAFSDGSDQHEAVAPVPVDPFDAALVERLRAGDEDAVRDLVALYADPLTRFAFVLTGSSDAAEGFAYDVLASAWERRAHLRPDRSLKTYLYTAVRRRCQDDADRRRVRERHADTLREQLSEQYSVPAPDDVLSMHEGDVAYAGRVQALRDAIAALSERRRLGLHLRFEQGLSYPAMGEILGLSDKGAQQLVLRALDTLRRMLGV